VNSGSSKSLSTLLEEEDNTRKTDFADEQPQSRDDPAELTTPTLLSLLKADPKLVSNIEFIDELGYKYWNRDNFE